jgi:uncharacterized ion transporter superfamily protein YfcC
MNAKDIAYIAVVVSVCIAIKFSELSLSTIIALNGTLLGFMFTYVLPIGLHIKCVYFS